MSEVVTVTERHVVVVSETAVNVVDVAVQGPPGSGGGGGGGAVDSVDGATGVVVLASDAAAGVGSKRTLGTGATQAAAGNHGHSGFEASGAVEAHRVDTTDVHGIVDTAALYRAGGTDVAVADGGTGASSSAQARTNLGLGTAATANTGILSGDVPILGTGGVLSIERLATGTPDGTKFVRDDGTLAVPSGGGGGSGLSHPQVLARGLGA